MQPLRAATECEVDLVRKRPDHGNGLRPGYRNSDRSFTYARLNPLDPDLPCEIGAKVVRHGRYIAFQMAEVAIPKNLFADILRLIAELRPPPATSTA